MIGRLAWARQLFIRAGCKDELGTISGRLPRSNEKIPDESVDAVITDPPYGIDYQSCMRKKDERFIKIANDKQPFIWWLHDAYRITKPAGCLMCFCRWDVQEAFRQAIEWAGFKVESQIIWDRKMHGMGDLKKQFAPSHDVIRFATKGNFEFPGNRPKSIISIPRVDANYLIHPNEKPIDLMEYLITCVTKNGDTIVEPFAGSGSTLSAAEQTGRDCIGIELSPDYCKIIRRRMSNIEPSLFSNEEADNGTID